MTYLDLSINAIVYCNGEQYKVMQQVTFTKIRAQHTKTGQMQYLEIANLTSTPPLSANENGSVKPVTRDNTPLESFSDKEWNDAKKRYEIISPLLVLSRTKAVVEARAKETDKDTATLYRWIRQFNTTGTISSLVPKNANKGERGKIRLDPNVQELLQDAIEEIYLNKQKPTVSTLYKEICIRCSRVKIIPPHQSTVRRYIDNLPQRDVVKRREGSSVSRKQFEMTPGRFPDGTYPLEVIQIDHTPMDIIIVDSEHRKPIGRPYLTLAIDIYSRMIAGYAISLEAPSYYSVSKCISNVVLPKTDLLSHLDIQGVWNVRGIPKTIHVDNAGEFRGTELQRVCDEYQINLALRPVARPQFGGHIERVIGTIMREIHKLPGTTYSNTTHRGRKNPNDEAVMTLGELERYLVQYIVNVYHKTIHSSIGMTPEKKYEIGIFGEGDVLGCGLPKFIEDQDTFKISLLPSVERCITRQGVVSEGITYFGDILRTWMDKGKLERKHSFRYDPADLSVLWFFDPEHKHYFPLPYRNMTFPPMSIWELREVKRRLKEKGFQDYDENAIFRELQKLNEMKVESADKSKQARRSISSKKASQSKKMLSQQVEQIKVSAIDSEFDSLFANAKPFDEIEVKKL